MKDARYYKRNYTERNRDVFTSKIEIYVTLESVKEVLVFLFPDETVEWRGLHNKDGFYKNFQDSTEIQFEDLSASEKSIIVNELNNK